MGKGIRCVGDKGEFSLPGKSDQVLGAYLFKHMAHVVRKIVMNLLCNGCLVAESLKVAELFAPMISFFMKLTLDPHSIKNRFFSFQLWSIVYWRMDLIVRLTSAINILKNIILIIP